MIKTVAFAASLAAFSLMVVGCGTGEAANPDSDPSIASSLPDAAVDGGGSTGSVDGSTAEGRGSNGSSGLPCDVEALLSKKCGECHGATPAYGAPMPLVTLADLTAPAKSNASKKVFELVGQRIHDDARPMPQAPNPRLSAADTATLDAWIAAGAPKGQGACGEVDGGAAGPKLSCIPDQHLAPASAYAVPSEKTNDYVCYGVDLAPSTKRHVIAIAPKVDNKKVVHHIVVVQVEKALSTTPTPCASGAIGSGRMIYAWAPGGGALELPAEAGFPQEGATHYLVQIHYNNAGGLSGEKDATGVDFCSTEKLRPNDADVMAFGSVNFKIPARGALDMDCDFKVPPTIKGDLHMFVAMPHMHQLGKLMTTTKLASDNGAPAVDMGNQPAWDFQTQSWFNIASTVKSGDTIRTRCSWNNTTTSAVGFGENTDDEMCWSFTMYYPKVTTPLWNWGLPSAFSKCTPH